VIPNQIVVPKSLSAFYALHENSPVQARFLLGPAGSGKTFRCLAEIRAELVDFGSQDSSRTILPVHSNDDSRRWFEDQIRARHPKVKIIQPQPGKAVEVRFPTIPTG